MHASPGDRIVIGSQRVGTPERQCDVLECRGSDGGPPYVVRWRDDGHEGLYFPGPGAVVQPAERTGPGVA